MAVFTMDKKAFGEALRAWRRGLSMTLEDMRAALKTRGHSYTAQAISAWERGESVPPASVVRSIEDRIGIAEGTLGIFLGYPAGDPLSERLEVIEARQEQQEQTLREIADQLRQLLLAPEPPKRGRR